jgi:uncharacterized membrane protein YhaH (DUF805 family)
MNVLQSALRPFGKFAQFKGRASRKEFWSYAVAVNVLQILIIFTVPFLFTISTLFLLLPSLAVLVRRLHDVNRSGWWALPMPFLFISIFFLYALTQFTLNSEDGKVIFASLAMTGLAIMLLGIALIVWTSRRGQAGANRFGDSPLTST